MASNNYLVYGVLYNWGASKTACPPGWHLPSDGEWMLLETHFGMSQSLLTEFNLRECESAWMKLRSASGWKENRNGDNASGFNALPGGQRHPQEREGGSTGFQSINTSCYFMTGTKINNSTFVARSLGWGGDGVSRFSWEKEYGFSVRCIKD